MFRLVVAGAHMSGLPLNHQLTEIGATLERATTTGRAYRMFDLGPGVKPALIRQPPGSEAFAFEVEVWQLPMAQVGPFIARGVKSPLAIGDVELADGSVAKGFVGESFGVAGCQDISSCGGWKRYVDAGPKAAAA